jgi:hypothetical protein
VRPQNGCKPATYRLNRRCSRHSDPAAAAWAEPTGWRWKKHRSGERLRAAEPGYGWLAFGSLMITCDAPRRALQRQQTTPTAITAAEGRPLAAAGRDTSPTPLSSITISTHCPSWR